MADVSYFSIFSVPFLKLQIPSLTSHQFKEYDELWISANSQK